MYENHLILSYVNIFMNHTGFILLFILFNYLFMAFKRLS